MSNEQDSWQVEFKDMIETFCQDNYKDDIILKFNNLLNDKIVSKYEKEELIQVLEDIKVKCQSIHPNLNSLKINGPEQDMRQTKVKYLLKSFTFLMLRESQQHYPKSFAELKLLSLDLQNRLHIIQKVLPKTFSNIKFILIITLLIIFIKYLLLFSI